MDLEERTRIEVERRLDRLRGEYGPFAVHEETVENDPDYFERGRRMAAEGWIGDAGAWVTDDEDRALLIRHAEEPDRWGVPGGGHEPGETLADTARREVREETGVECSLDDVRFARRKTVVLESDPDRRFHAATVVFDATYRDGDLSIGDDEVLEAAWFADPPDALVDFVRERVADTRDVRE